MAYTKTTWVDEVLAGAERFKILDNVGAAPDSWADLANCQIALATGITTTGTPVNATLMNNIENGIYDLSRGVAMSVKGITGGVTGDVADIVASVDGHVLRRSGTTLAFGQITTAGIADRAVTAGKIANATITGTQLASGAVTAGKIGTGGISASAQFSPGVVGSAALTTGAVTAGKIATGGVSATEQIADGIITNVKLADHKELVYLKVFWEDEDLTTGNGKAWFTVPAYLAGTITDFDIAVHTASTSGRPTVQMANCGSNPDAAGTDILSTRATIDTGEWSSMTAVTQPVIGANNTVAPGDVLRVDVDAIGTGTQGLDIFFVIEKSS